MSLNWIKNLFKHNNLAKNDNNAISIIDTDFIQIPNIKELSKRDQGKVIKYIDEINYDNYETIVKYSNDLLLKSNDEIAILNYLFDKYNKENQYPISAPDGIHHRYINSSIFLGEINIIFNNLLQIRKELELRIVAFNMYVKKEEKRKYDFLGIFGKAERLRYLSDKSNLLDTIKRLKIALKINTQHLLIAYEVKDSNQVLLDRINNNFSYNNILDNIDGDLSEYDLCQIVQILRYKYGEINKKITNEQDLQLLKQWYPLQYFLF